MGGCEGRLSGVLAFMSAAYAAAAGGCSFANGLSSVAGAAGGVRNENALSDTSQRLRAGARTVDDKKRFCSTEILVRESLKPSP